MFFTFEITSSEEAFLLSFQLYMNVSSMTSPSSRALGHGGGEKGQLVRLSEGQPNLQRCMQASLLNSYCHDVDLSLAGHGHCPVLHSCTFDVTKGPAKSFESSLVIFPRMLWFFASSNQPCLEQLTKPVRGSPWQSLLQELGGLILGDYA